MNITKKLNFDSKLLHLINVLAKSGKKEVEISRILGISQNTLTHYKKQYEELKRAIKAGKAEYDEISNNAVERSLFARATGYTYEESTVDSTGKKQMVQRHVPPDINAIKFWLKNRKSSDWKETQDVNHGVAPSAHFLIAQSLKELDDDEEKL